MRTSPSHPHLAHEGWGYAGRAEVGQRVEIGNPSCIFSADVSRPPHVLSHFVIPIYYQLYRKQKYHQYIKYEGSDIIFRASHV